MSDIRTNLIQRNIPFRENTGWVQICCPFCNDSKFKGGISKKDGHFFCFKCGGHSNYEIEKIIGVSTFFGRVIERKHKKNIDFNFSPLSAGAIKYLQQRGFDPDELVKKYKIADGGYTGDWAYRIMIPVIENNQIVAFQGRDWTKKAELRYKSTAIEQSVKSIKDCLYNIDNASLDRFILLEGVVDVWRLGNGAVSGFGMELSEEQKRLLKTKKKVIICFDSEFQAQQKAHKLAREIDAFMDVVIVDLEVSKDFGAMEQKEADTIKRELCNL